MPRILVVGTETHLSRLIEVNMRRNGHEVYSANSEGEALTRVQNNPPDILVIGNDPAFGTFEARLAEDPRTSDIKVIRLADWRGPL